MSSQLGLGQGIGERSSLKACVFSLKSRRSYLVLVATIYSSYKQDIGLAGEYSVRKCASRGKNENG